MNAKRTLMALALVGAVGVGVVGAQPGGPRGGNPGGNPPDDGRGRGTMLQEREWLRGTAPRDVVAAVIRAAELNRAEVRRALRSGSTLADLITANGGDVNVVTADAIAILTAQVERALANGRITQAQADALIADIEQRVTDAINGEVEPGGRLRDRATIRLPLDRMALIEAAMDATGLTRGQIWGQLIDGATLGSIIAGNGGDVDAVIASVTENAALRLEAAVADGRITQARADQLLQQFTEMLRAAMEGTLRPLRELL
jgi:hypothetical protein